jgi:SAM-dependent methyltransferase
MPRDHLDLDSRFAWAIQTLKQLKLGNPRIQTVFDIGSGNESLRGEIGKMGLDYRSFDLFPQNENVRQWNIEERFPHQGTADVALCLEIVEHLNNPWLGMGNVGAVIRPGGFLIMSTPNPSWSESRLHLLSAGVLGMFTEEDLSLNHHVFTPWQHIIRSLLLDNGFENIHFHALGKATSVFAQPLWGLKLPLRVGFRLIKKLIENLDSSAVGALYGVQAQKKRSGARQ